MYMWMPKKTSYDRKSYYCFITKWYNSGYYKFFFIFLGFTMFTINRYNFFQDNNPKHIKTGVGHLLLLALNLFSSTLLFCPIGWQTWTSKDQLHSLGSGPWLVQAHLLLPCFNQRLIQEMVSKRHIFRSHGLAQDWEYICLEHWDGSKVHWWFLEKFPCSLNRDLVERGLSLFSLDSLFQLSMGLSIESEKREQETNGVRYPKLCIVESYFTHFPKKII